MTTTFKKMKHFKNFVSEEFLTFGDTLVSLNQNSRQPEKRINFGGTL